MAENSNGRPPFERVTVSLPGGLLAEVENHRSNLGEQTGITHLSRSAAMAQLLRAGLAANGKAPKAVENRY